MWVSKKIPPYKIRSHNQPQQKYIYSVGVGVTFSSIDSIIHSMIYSIIYSIIYSVINPRGAGSAPGVY